ncbi:MAG: tetratricopeptide repeat protein [Candidatus Thorarchaeota archaeon]
MDDKRRKLEAKNFYNFGMDYIRHEFWNKAEYAFQKAVAIDLNLAIAWAYLSKLYQKKGLTKEAKIAYDKALEIDDSIDFVAVERNCRPVKDSNVEDRKVIISKFRNFRKGISSTTEFIEFVTSLSIQEIALITDEESNKRFFKLAVESAVIENVSQLEFKSLPAFLSQVSIPFTEVVKGMEQYTVAALLSTNVNEDYIKFLDFMQKKLEGNLHKKVKQWILIGDLLDKTKPKFKILFKKATSLLAIIDDLEKDETLEEILVPLRKDAIGIIIRESVTRGREGARFLLDAFNRTHYEVINFIGANLISVLVIEKDRKPSLKFYKMIEEELAKIETTKNTLTRAKQWLDVLLSIDKKFSQSISKFDQIINLLDVIEETKGTLEPTVIAEQCLRMMEGSMDEGWKDRWLDSIKKAYYKIIFITRNQQMKFNDVQKERLVEIAKTMLRFLITCRINELIQRTVDDRFLRKPLLEVFFPEHYQSFQIPALYALNEFYKNPYILAAKIKTGGERQRISAGKWKLIAIHEPGPKISVGKWKLAAAISLLALPQLLFLDLKYIDFVIPEYLKTLALGVKHAELYLDHFLSSGSNVTISSKNLMVDIMKGISDSSATQITRAQIIEALEFGGWDSSMADKIIEDKKYCLYCSFQLPHDAKTCSNCGKPIISVDLSETTFDDIDPEFYV